MQHLEAVSEPARRLYQAMVNVSHRGICKSNQRQLIAITGMAFKTLIALRDELVARGLIKRIFHYRGKRDWYKIVPETELDRAAEAAARERRRAAALADARAEHERMLPLGI
jgi:hypothetical protein